MANNKNRTTISSTSVNHSWLKNALKSIGSTVKSEITSVAPNISEVVSSTSNTTRNIIRNMRQNKTNETRITNTIKNNKYMRTASTAMKNLMSDLRTGNFNNQDREMESMMSGFDDESNSGISFGDDDTGNININVNDGGSTIGFDNISNQLAKNTEAQLKMNKANLDAFVAVSSSSMLQTAKIGEEMNTHLSNISNSIQALVQYNNTTMNNYIRTSMAYYERLGSRIESAIDESMKNKKIDGYSMIKGSSGGLNFGEYKKYIVQEFKRSGLGSYLSILDDDMLKTLAANPLGMVTKVVTEKVMPKFITQTLGSMEKVFNTVVPTFLHKLGDWANDYSAGLTGTIKRFLGNTFGLKSDLDKKISSGSVKLDTGPVPFDGKTRHTINNILTKELREQTQYLKIIANHYDKNATKNALNNSDVFDFNSKKWIKHSDINNNILSGYRDSIIREFENSLLGKSMSKSISNSGLSDKNMESFSKALEQVYLRIAGESKSIDTSKGKMGDISSKFIDSINASESVKRVLKDALTEIYKTNPAAFHNINNTKISAQGSARKYMDNIRNNPGDHNWFDSTMGDKDFYTMLMNQYGMDYDLVDESGNYILDNNGKRKRSKRDRSKRLKFYSGRDQHSAKRNFIEGVRPDDKDAPTNFESSLWNIFFGDGGSGAGNIGQRMKDSARYHGRAIKDNLFTNPKAAISEVGNLVVDQVGIVLNQVNSKIGTSLSKYLLGTRDSETGERSGGLFSSVLNDLTDATAHLKNKITGKEYKDSKGNVIPATDDSVIGTFKSTFKSINDGIKNVLFGDKDDDTGKRVGGVISKHVQDYVKDHKAELGLGAIGGLGVGAIVGGGGLGILGSILGGPVAGTLLGIGASIGLKSKSFQEFIFGNEKTGQLGAWDKLKIAIAKHQKDTSIKLNQDESIVGTSIFSAGAGALAGMGLAKAGLLAGVMGPHMLALSGALGGLTLAIGAHGKSIKTWLFGEKDESTGEKKDGLLGKMANMVNVTVLQPMKREMKYYWNDVKLTFRDHILFPIKQSIEPAVDVLYGIKDTVSSVVKTLLGGIGTTVKGLGTSILDITSSVLKPLTSVATHIAGGIVKTAAKTAAFPFKVAAKVLNMANSKLSQGLDYVKEVIKNGVTTVTDYVKEVVVDPIKNFIQNKILKPVGGFLVRTITAPFRLVGGLTKYGIDKFRLRRGKDVGDFDDYGSEEAYQRALHKRDKRNNISDRRTEAAHNANEQLLGKVFGWDSRFTADTAENRARLEAYDKANKTHFAKKLKNVDPRKSSTGKESSEHNGAEVMTRDAADLTSQDLQTRADVETAEHTSRIRELLSSLVSFITSGSLKPMNSSDRRESGHSRIQNDVNQAIEDSRRDEENRDRLDSEIGFRFSDLYGKNSRQIANDVRKAGGLKNYVKNSFSKDAFAEFAGVGFDYGPKTSFTGGFKKYGGIWGLGRTFITRQNESSIDRKIKELASQESLTENRRNAVEKYLEKGDLDQEEKSLYDEAVKLDKDIQDCKAQITSIQNDLENTQQEVNNISEQKGSKQSDINKLLNYIKTTQQKILKLYNIQIKLYKQQLRLFVDILKRHAIRKEDEGIDPNDRSSSTINHYADGTLYAEKGKAKVGERGKEILVQDNKPTWVGLNGEELINLRGGEQILPHDLSLALTDNSADNGDITGLARRGLSSDVAFNLANDTGRSEKQQEELEDAMATIARNQKNEEAYQRAVEGGRTKEERMAEEQLDLQRKQEASLSSILKQLVIDKTMTLGEGLKSFGGNILSSLKDIGKSASTVLKLLAALGIAEWIANIIPEPDDDTTNKEGDEAGLFTDSDGNKTIWSEETGKSALYLGKVFSKYGFIGGLKRLGQVGLKGTDLGLSLIPGYRKTKKKIKNMIQLKDELNKLNDSGTGNASIVDDINNTHLKAYSSGDYDNPKKGSQPSVDSYNDAGGNSSKVDTDVRKPSNIDSTPKAYYEQVTDGYYHNQGSQPTIDVYNDTGSGYYTNGSSTIDSTVMYGDNMYMKSSLTTAEQKTVDDLVDDIGKFGDEFSNIASDAMDNPIISSVKPGNVSKSTIKDAFKKAASKKFGELANKIKTSVSKKSFKFINNFLKPMIAVKNKMSNFIGKKLTTLFSSLTSIFTGGPLGIVTGALSILTEIMIPIMGTFENALNPECICRLFKIDSRKKEHTDIISWPMKLVSGIIGFFEYNAEPITGLIANLILALNCVFYAYSGIDLIFGLATEVVNILLLADSEKRDKLKKYQDEFKETHKQESGKDAEKSYDNLVKSGYIDGSKISKKDYVNKVLNGEIDDDNVKSFQEYNEYVNKGVSDSVEEAITSTITGASKVISDATDIYGNNKKPHDFISVGDGAYSKTDHHNKTTINDSSTGSSEMKMSGSMNRSLSQYVGDRYKTNSYIFNPGYKENDIYNNPGILEKINDLYLTNYYMPDGSTHPSSRTVEQFVSKEALDEGEQLMAWLLGPNREPSPMDVQFTTDPIFTDSAGNQFALKSNIDRPLFFYDDPLGTNDPRKYVLDRVYLPGKKTFYNAASFYKNIVGINPTKVNESIRGDDINYAVAKKIIELGGAGPEGDLNRYRNIVVQYEQWKRRTKKERKPEETRINNTKWLNKTKQEYEKQLSSTTDKNEKSRLIKKIDAINAVINPAQHEKKLLSTDKFIRYIDPITNSFYIRDIKTDKYCEFTSGGALLRDNIDEKTVYGDILTGMYTSVEIPASDYMKLMDIKAIDLETYKSRYTFSSRIDLIRKQFNSQVSTNISSRSAQLLAANNNTLALARNNYMWQSSQGEGVRGGGYGPESLNNFKYYSQNDSKWGNMTYSQLGGYDGATMGTSGCGPTAMSMVVSQLRNNNVSPVEMARVAQMTGHRDGTGTNWNFIDTASSLYGTPSMRTYNPSASNIALSLDSGQPMILSGVSNGSSSPYTSAGHYIVAVGRDSNGNVIVNDPRGKTYSRHYNINSLAKMTDVGWSFMNGGFGRNRKFSGRRRTRGGRGDYVKEYRALLVSIAKSQIGNVGGTPYKSYCGLSTTSDVPGQAAWCAAFVSWCFKQAGIESLLSTPKSTNAGQFRTGLKGVLRKASSKYNPMAGDIILFFGRTEDGLGSYMLNNYNVSSHVGIVEGKDGNGNIITIEGNTDGSPLTSKVQRRTYDPSYEGIQYYVQPKYDLLTSTPPNVDLNSLAESTGDLSSTMVNDVSTELGTPTFLSALSALSGEYVNRVTRAMLGEDVDTDFSGFVSNLLGNSSSTSYDTGNTILTGNDTAEKIWNFFASKGMPAAGIAGLMGNLYAESGLLPNNLEQTANNKGNMSDSEFTKQVDSGSRGRDKFIRDYDLSVYDGGIYGYGLAQWTSDGRKAKLYDYIKKKGVSIGDLTGQLEFLHQELKNSYPSVYRTLMNPSSTLKEASDDVLLHFEVPADQSDSMKNRRAGYGKQYYDKFAGGGNGSGIRGRNIRSSNTRKSSSRRGGGNGAGTSFTKSSPSIYNNPSRYYDREVERFISSSNQNTTSSYVSFMKTTVKLLYAIAENTHISSDKLSLLEDLSMSSRTSFNNNSSNNIIIPGGNNGRTTNIASNNTTTSPSRNTILAKQIARG